MPQLQLPIFPDGVTEINSRIAVQKDASAVWYIHGHLPVFQHAEGDVQSFRMFTSQMIATGTVKSKGNRADVWRADDHGEEVREAVPRPGSQRVLRSQAAPQFGVGAERSSAGASAALAG